MSDSIEKRVQRGMIVEFDYAVLPGHQLLLDVYKAQFAEVGLNVDATLMARHMLGKPFAHAVTALMTHQGKEVDAQAIVALCTPAFSAALTDALADVPAEFKTFVDAVLEKDVKVILISRANADAVRAMFPNVEKGLAIQTDTSSGFGFLGWDVWRRTARKNDLRERLCVAITGSGFSIKGVLTSSMGVMFKENPLVAYQDFGGADVAIEKFDVALVKEVARILRI
ncbi:MAG: hypothetical protein FWH21_07880 [Kiritimatiellaeota bacterium]|nr:hypothetical protein [Kiritimatiellota bacterium]